MNIVKTNPKSWKLPVVRREDGTIERVLDHVNAEAEQIDNVVFEGRLRYLGHQRNAAHSVKHLFKEEQSEMLLRFGPKTMEALLESIAEGTTKVVGGSFRGLFTFKSFAGYIFVMPLSEKDMEVMGLP